MFFFLLVSMVSSQSLSIAGEKDHMAPTGGPLQPPLIIAPEERAEFRGMSSIAFIWQKVGAAAGYHIILARDRRFKRIIHENTRVTGTFYTIDKLDFGTYFFKISSVAEDGDEGPFSATFTFIIVPQPPSGKLQR